MSTGSGSERPPVDLSRVVVNPESVKLLAYGFCKKKRVVVLGRVDPNSAGAVPVGMVDAGDAELIGTLRSFLQRPIEPVAMQPLDVQHALDAGYGVVGDASATAITVGGALPLSPDDPIDALTMDLLQRAGAVAASHLHVTPAPHGVALRVRVAGILRPLASPIGPENVAAVIARLCALAGLGETDPTRLQRGTFVIDPEAGQPGPGTTVTVCRSNTDAGDELVLRMQRRAADPALGALGMDPSQRDVVEALLGGPDGLVLVAGPGGSGRTTTLRAMLGQLDRTRRRVIALGDTFAALDGIDVRSPDRLGGDLAHAIMACTDLDADVVVVDPLGGREELRACTEAAERGQLVLGVVHGLDAVDAISALDRGGVPRQTAASVLRGVVAPRLLSRACPHCRVATDDGEGEARWNAPGCAACAGTGMLGQIAVFEALWLTASLADHVAGGAAVHEIRTHAIGDGMRTLLNAAQDRVVLGEVSHAAVRAGLPLRLLE